MIYRLRGDNMILFNTVKSCYTLNCYIITFCGTRSKNYFFRITANQISNLLYEKKRTKLVKFDEDSVTFKQLFSLKNAIT